MSYSEEDFAKLEFWPANLPKMLKDDRPAEKTANEPAASNPWVGVDLYRQYIQNIQNMMNVPSYFFGQHPYRATQGSPNQCDPRQAYLREYAKHLGRSMAQAKGQELQELYNLYRQQMDAMRNMYTPFVAGGPLGHSCRTPEKKPAIETLLTKKPKKKGFFKKALKMLWK